MMGGVISVSGKKGRGSVFTVTLRNVRKAEGSYVPEKKDDISADSVYIFSQAAILIADDITENRILLTDYLEDYGFEFIEAEDGRQAVNLARDRHPDLILMDMKMPVMDGREAAEKLKSDDDTKDIPIIAVTATAMKDAEEEISGLCDGYSKKPVKKADVIAELTRFLKHTEKKAVSEGFEPTHSEEKSESPPYKLDAETMKRVPEFINMLESEFMPRWEEINDMLIMDEAQEFADDLTHIGREYGLPPLKDYGCRFAGCVQAYDTVGVKMYLAEFPKIIERLRRLGDRGLNNK